MAYTRFRVTGKVRGQGRPRFTRTGNAYKAKADRDYENEIKKAYINSGGVHYGDKPIFVTVSVHRALPKNTPKSIKEVPDTVRIDCDNILKSVMDALNGIAYDDDSQVVQASIYKSPRTRCVEHMIIYVGTQEEL